MIDDRAFDAKRQEIKREFNRRVAERSIKYMTMTAFVRMAVNVMGELVAETLAEVSAGKERP